jgi:hypothetical protein
VSPKFGDVIEFSSLADLMDGVRGDAPRQWWWCSFADPERPEGSHLLGVAIVHAANVGHAASVAWRMGCNPGGQMLAMPVPSEFGAPPLEWDHKLITDKSQIKELTQRWHGCDALSIAEFEGAQP